MILFNQSSLLSWIMFHLIFKIRPQHDIVIVSTITMTIKEMAPWIYFIQVTLYFKVKFLFSLSLYMLITLDCPITQSVWVLMASG